MKTNYLQLAILLAVMTMPVRLSAQIPVNSVVTGLITEKETKEPVEFASVGLYHANDSTLIAVATTGKNGEFIFLDVTPGTYYILVSCLGFEQETIPAFSIKDNNPLNLGTTPLKISSILLNEVSVTREKSVLSNSIDRKVYNVEKDILGQTGSASDVLENIPSVSVDVDGTVSLRGSANVTFFIDGKPSALLKHNSATALQQIPASAIDRIEVITNPSAKYKPDGISGIINLVLKKSRKQGFNGIILANAGNQDRYNANITVNYNTGKMNIFGSYGFRQNNSPRTGLDSRINRDSLLNIINLYDSRSSSASKPVSHTGNFGFEFQFNENNKLEISGNMNFQDVSLTQNTLSTWKNAETTVTSEYNTQRTNQEKDLEWETSARFLHQFEKEGHELQFELNCTGYDESEDSHFTEDYSFPQVKEDLSHILIKKGGPQAEFYIEYTLPINEETELEAGYVGEFFKDNINYLGENYNGASNRWFKDLSKSNDFIFHQNTHAIYSTFSHSFDKLSFMAGLRAEQVNILSNLITLDSIVPNNYFRLYPTLHLTYDLDEFRQFQINYSHRVRRPDSDEMNPFPEYSDPRNMETGNPHVKPEQIHSIEAGYQLKKEKFSIQPTLYYRYKYDAFTEIQKYVNDTVLLTTFENLSRDQSLGMEFITSLNAARFISLNLSTNGYYHVIDASNLGYSDRKSTFSLNSKLGANINITHSTLMQVYAYHRTSVLSAQGRTNPVFYVNMGLRQDLFKNKASVLLTVSDVFNTLKSNSIIDTPRLYEKRIRGRVSQIVYFGFTYRFGKSEKKKQEDLKFDDTI